MRLGRNLYAVRSSKQSALMLGINVRRTKFIAYLACRLLSGLGGLVFLLHTGPENAANTQAAEMSAIAAAIMAGTLLTGGVGNVIATSFSVLTQMLIRSLVVTSGLSEPWWQSITTDAMLAFSSSCRASWSSIAAKETEPKKA